MDLDGGFIRPMELTPAPSSINSGQANLPHPRSTPLKSGSNKESIFRQYLDNNISEINRKHALRSSEKRDGWASFADISKELVNLFNLIWISSTRK
jgi:Sec7-like guanine-nucleotide exchange factor